MIPIQLPSSFQHLSQGLWRIVVVGRGSDGNLFQFGFQVDVQPAEPIVSAAPSVDAVADVQSVPKRALRLALAEFDSYACQNGAMNVVSAKGATTAGELDDLFPLSHRGRSAAELPSSTPIYGAVLQGRCAQGGGRDAVQGYMLFGDGGRLYYGRLWDEGSEPKLHEAFGPEVDAGLLT